jgi:ubiquinone/menaquinone biosynthesis C-methylase UbiE
MTKNQIKKEFVRALKEGRLIDPNQKGQVEVFNVSMDKYSDIIYAIQSKKRVLDVGCAGGVMLSMLHKLGHECHGVDIVDRSEEHSFIFKDKGIQFSVANAEVDPMPYPDNYFDAVTCGQCLEHFTHSPRHAMEEFYRVLKPGGIVQDCYAAKILLGTSNLLIMTPTRSSIKICPSSQCAITVNTRKAN